MGETLEQRAEFAAAAGRARARTRCRSTSSTRGPARRSATCRCMSGTDALRTIAAFRLALPRTILRYAGGREITLGDLGTRDGHARRHQRGHRRQLPDHARPRPRATTSRCSASSRCRSRRCPRRSDGQPQRESDASPRSTVRPATHSGITSGASHSLRAGVRPWPFEPMTRRQTRLRQPEPRAARRAPRPQPVELAAAGAAGGDALPADLQQHRPDAARLARSSTGTRWPRSCSASSSPWSSTGRRGADMFDNVNGVELTVFIVLFVARQRAGLRRRPLAPGRRPRAPRRVGPGRAQLRALDHLVPARRRPLHGVHVRRRARARLRRRSDRLLRGALHDRGLPDRVPRADPALVGLARARLRHPGRLRTRAARLVDARPARRDHRHRRDDALHRAAARRHRGRAQGDGRHRPRADHRGVRDPRGLHLQLRACAHRR